MSYEEIHSLIKQKYNEYVRSEQEQVISEMKERTAKKGASGALGETNEAVKMIQSFVGNDVPPDLIVQILLVYGVYIAPKVREEIQQHVDFALSAIAEYLSEAQQS